MKRITEKLSDITKAFEFCLALLLLCVVLVTLFSSLLSYPNLDWSLNQTFYDFIYRILLLVIGLELARLLITHNIQTVIELIAFVIARKTLKPDITSSDILFTVSAFFLLVLSRFLIDINIKDLLSSAFHGRKDKQ